jgi:hypothetical protein
MILGVKQKGQKLMKSMAEEEKYWREHHQASVSAR